MTNYNQVSATIKERIKSQLGLNTDDFTISDIAKEVTSTDGILSATCQIPSDWYLVTIALPTGHLKNGFVWLDRMI